MKLSPIVILIFVILSVSKTYANKECGNIYCTESEWYNNGGRFDPLSIQWPLHYTGIKHVDKIDGGFESIDVYFKDHYSHFGIRLSLAEFRTRPECPDPNFLKDGVGMNPTFECTASVTDKPYWKASNCSLVMSGYEDQYVYIDGPSCSKLLRHWTLIDWCKYKPNHGANNSDDKIELVKDLVHHKFYFAFGNDKGDFKEDGYYTFTQVIKIVDSYKPEFVSCTDQEFDLKGKCEANVKIKKKVIDTGQCKGKYLDISVEVFDKWGKNLVKKWLKADESKEFEVALGYLSAGDYLLIWKATDGCGNTTICSSRLKVYDKSGPYLLCIQKLSTAVSDKSGVSIWAKDFVLKLENSCGSGPISVSFSSTSHVPSLTFNCSDDFGFKELKIYATDSYGNQSSCYVELFISDHFTCSDSMAIAGLVFNKFLNPIENVRMDVMKNESKVAKSKTNTKGHYAIKGIPMTKSEAYLEASVNDTKTQGLDASDLILLLRHIYGIQKFTDVLQFAAADINSDATIDMKDYWALADLIYDLPTHDTKVASWKFIDSKLYFAGINRASQLTIPIPIREFRHRYDVLGLKNGDINFSWKANPDAENRSSKKLYYSQVHSSTGIVTNFDLTNFVEANGLHFEIQGKHSSFILKNNILSDQSQLTVVECNSKTIIHLMSPQSISDAARITQMVLPPKSILNGNVHIQYIIADQVYNDAYVLVETNALNLIDSEPVISPNPFNSYLDVNLNLAENQSYELRLYDLQGRIHFRENYKLIKGENKLSIRSLQSSPEGIYLLSLIGPEGQKVYKVIKN